MSNKSFWQVATAAVLKTSKADGKTRIEYDGDVAFPESGPVVNGEEPAMGKQLVVIYFSGDELGADVLRVRPTYAVLADVAVPDPYNVPPELMAQRMSGSQTGLPAIVYKTVPKPDGQNYMEAINQDHPHFAQTGTAPPPVTTPPPVQTTPPPVVTPPTPQPPGGEGAGGRYLGVVPMDWPKDQDYKDIKMGGADWVDIEMVVDPNLNYDPNHEGFYKAVEHGGQAIMHRMMVYSNDVGVYGMAEPSPANPLSTRPQASYRVGAAGAEITHQKSDLVRVRIVNHGLPSENGSIRFENLSPSRY